MRTSFLTGLGAGAVAAALFAGGIAYARASGSDGPQGPVQPAGRQAGPLAAIDTAGEAKFTSIPPCRAVDTRGHGDAFANGERRTFQLGGSGSLASQGGSATGCGLPTRPVAVSATITTVAVAKGALKAWAAGAPTPATSFMNYGTSFNASTGGTIPVDTLGRIQIENSGGPTNVIVDITGYFVAPMVAYVSTNGMLVRGSRVTGVIYHPLNTGTYEVDFDRNVSACAYAVSTFEPGKTIGVEPRTTNPNGVFVFFEDPAEARTDAAFYLTVTC